MAVEGGGAGLVLVFVIEVDEVWEIAFEIFGLASDNAEATLSDFFKDGGVIGDVGGDFFAILLRNNIELFEAFEGGIDSGALFADSVGDLGRGALAVFDKEEVDFGLERSEADLDENFKVGA